MDSGTYNQHPTGKIYFSQFFFETEVKIEHDAAIRILYSWWKYSTQP